MNPMLNEALKQIRLFHRLKQIELATELCISKSYLSEIESGRKSVSIELLEKYADHFSIPISSLMLFSENMEAAKKSDKFRLGCARKIIKIMEWIGERDQIKEET